MLRAFIFDIGGVLVRTENLAPRRQWEQRLGLKDWELARLVFNNPIARQAQHGLATWDDNWADVRQKLSVSDADFEQLKIDFWLGDVWDESLVGFIASLRPRFKTGVISNALPGTRENVLVQVGPETFDDLVFSYEVGIMKPAPEIYQRVLTRLGVSPAEAVFVDDFIENIHGAQAVGLQTIHFTDAATVRAELEHLLTTT
jgi:HAD superfamily hydrolase (TIGR01549 family)